MSAELYAFRRNLVVAASAGTGKTHALVGVVVHLLLGASELGGRGLHDPIDPSRIVATTFSRKAAAEIRTRVVMALERLASGDASAPYRADVLAAVARAGATWKEQAIVDRARRARDRVASARIGTLHGFAAQITQRFALERARSPVTTLETEDETRARVRGAIEDVIGARFGAGDASVRSLVRATGGADVLVEQVAGALARLEEDGRGAAECTIATDDARLVEAHVRSLVDLARALGESKRLGEAARMTVAAFDAGDERAFAEAFEELVSQRRGKGTAAEEAFFEARDALPKGASFADRARALTRAYAARAELEANAVGARALLAACEAEIRARAVRDSVLGFGDVLRAARDVLRDRPDVAAELGGELDVLLVDEFQDTSRLQRELVEHVWERDPRTRTPGAPAHVERVRAEGLFVVGDRKQSIYAFRGADVGVFTALCIGLAGAPARVALGVPKGATYEPEEPRADFVSLRHNRRSEPEVLAFVNAFSARRLCPAIAPPELYEIVYAPDVEDLLPPPEKPASTGAARATWIRPEVERGASRKIDEARAIAASVKRIVAEGEGETRWRDCAVLAESNAMLDVTAFALGRAGIPYVVAGSGFHAAREVRDMLALLAVVVSEGDTLALLTVLRGPWIGAHDDTILALTDPHRGLADPRDWERGERRARVRPEDRAAIARAREIVLTLRAHADALGAEGTLRAAVRAFALEEALVQLPRGAQRVANVRKLLSLARRAQTPRSFLEAMRDAAARDARETEAATFSDDDDAVRLLTVHASKGLAFPIVFVPQVGAIGRTGDEGAIVIEPRGDDPPRLAVRVALDDAGAPIAPPSFERAVAAERRRARAERARLAYVAVTRAERRVLLVGDRRVGKEGASEAYASTSVAALAEVADARPHVLAVEGAGDVDAGAPIAIAQSATRARDVPQAPFAPSPPTAARLLATAALQDFACCPRRFELLHLVDLPEPRGWEAVDARAEAALHRVLERVDASAFGARDASDAIARVLDRDRVARDDPARAIAAKRAQRFLATTYAARLRDATIERDSPFVVTLEDAERTRVRGAIDLLAAWRDGSVDVVAYKNARVPSPEPYAAQLTLYALGARALYPDARVRAGIVFLGADAPEPRWLSLDAPDALHARAASLARQLASSPTSFARVAPARCRALGCGYLSLCHPGA
jgi:ATP-dependent helicase/nuclease subunit A